MLLILKIIKIFKKCYRSVVVMWQHMFSVPVMCTVWRRELDTDKEINKKLPEDDLTEDQNTLE
jgi:hypothetical protein